MNASARVSVVIAVSSPVISSGLSVTLRRIPDISVAAEEVASYKELVDHCNRNAVGLVIVNPTFGGIFNPDRFRADVPDDVRLMVIETGPMSAHTRNLFDASIGIMDDLAAISRKIRDLVAAPEDAVRQKDQLSQREKEIITLVVKGLTNKEIADALFISVHTVITHRRNIARKLEIHSATGLTIYAIVNHLVDIADIKI